MHCRRVSSIPSLYWLDTSNTALHFWCDNKLSKCLLGAKLSQLITLNTKDWSRKKNIKTENATDEKKKKKENATESWNNLQSFDICFSTQCQSRSTHEFIQSFNEFPLRIYWVSGRAQKREDITVKRANTATCLIRVPPAQYLFSKVLSFLSSFPMTVKRGFQIPRFQ